MKILIENVSAIPMTKEDLVLEGVNIEIIDEKIKRIGKFDIENKIAYDRVIDGKGRLALPGFINAHTHLGMSFLRNYADDLDLMDWLQKEMWPMEAKFTREDIRLASKLSMVEMIKSGISSFVDMYFELDGVCDEAINLGMRAFLTPGFLSDGKKEERIDNMRKLYRTCNGKAGLVSVMPAPHAPYTVVKEDLVDLKELAKEFSSHLHIHVAETKGEEEGALKNYGKSTVAYLNEIGLFEVPVIAAHCVHVTDSDMEIMAEKKVSAVHNPSSNLKLASGFARVQDMLDKGVNVCLGTDSSSSNNNLNMVEEIHMASLLAKSSTGNPKALSAYKTLELATVNGAKALGMEDSLGKLEEGYLADLMLIDLEKIHLQPLNNLISLVVYSAQASDVSELIINGRIVMENGKIEGIDEKALIQEANKRLDELKK